MQVLKFGGTSVANATAISRVMDIIDDTRQRGKVVLVSSAISGCTDALIAMTGDEASRESGAKILHEKHQAIVTRLFTGKEREEVLRVVHDTYAELLEAPAEDYQTFGELFSTRIIAAKLRCDGINTLWIDSRDLIRTKNGVVDKELSYRKIRNAIESHPEVDVFVAPGFIASDENGHVCTLGRGGSDYSAALYAAALNADTLQIWTDVPGIMTTNPKDVPSAKTIPTISYEAAFCLAAHGAKVLYAPTVQPAMETNIAIQILDTFHPKHSGTVIKALPKRGHGHWIGLACQKTADAAQICMVADGRIAELDLKEVKNRLERVNVIANDVVLEGDDHIILTLPLGEEKEALRILHYFCFEAESAIDVYLAGQGKVGKALLDIIDKTDNRINVRLISQHESDNEAFFAEMLSNESEKAVFVDCTDSETISKWYVPVLEAGINVVTSNRRAISVPYEQYALMRRTARRKRRFLRYDTTVGTALPILDSINMSANSADEILSIEAVVSCTLNYILTSGLPFDEALKKAQSIGLTEKDPSQDLCGSDALRKLLILAREAGVPLDEKDVEIEPVEGSKVQTNQRFIASLEKDETAPLGYRASIRLRTIDESHPAWSLRGTDNAIIIRSAFHPKPLLIQGAGEGAKMAASSVLNDILR